MEYQTCNSPEHRSELLKYKRPLSKRRDDTHYVALFIRLSLTVPHATATAYGKSTREDCTLAAFLSM